MALTNTLGKPLYALIAGAAFLGSACVSSNKEMTRSEVEEMLPNLLKDKTIYELVIEDYEKEKPSSKWSKSLNSALWDTFVSVNGVEEGKQMTPSQFAELRKVVESMHRKSYERIKHCKEALNLWHKNMWPHARREMYKFSSSKKDRERFFNGELRVLAKDVDAMNLAAYAVHESFCFGTHEDTRKKIPQNLIEAYLNNTCEGKYHTIDH